MGRKALTRWRRLLKTAGVICALVAGALVLPETARASCGDYVTVNSPHDGTPPGGQTGTENESRPSSHQSSRDRHPSPCSGPGCSRLPLSTPPPPESSVTNHGERWADLTGAVPPAESPRAALAPGERTTGLARYPSDVYHPPR
jgi:hypothetical protein